ncbi:hypothetical protein HETIRDRAFT_439169 [Heterobasidion irregulare TC 32-1]|uniref:Uncharacterized protein n=1 Tax=Heterobasidion irregulare (strain TC 32-1) TaxID=747525 RepID=W4KH91_HETIT|nr:uncharacterized protein HETIRDRAFT_439169 [Heterobasidion irregulare TC 32-1]ETW84411.1 hypothetical protein HETIRDRAFT_439169 [Heterobasidion irregulare TC 32-1]
MHPGRERREEGLQVLLRGGRLPAVFRGKRERAQRALLRAADKKRDGPAQRAAVQEDDQAADTAPRGRASRAGRGGAGRRVRHGDTQRVDGALQGVFGPIWTTLRGAVRGRQTRLKYLGLDARIWNFLIAIASGQRPSACRAGMFGMTPPAADWMTAAGERGR